MKQQLENSTGEYNMKMIFKTILIVTAFCCFSALFCACSSSNAQTDKESSAQIDIDIQTGNYYLNGDSNSRCITVSADQTFQFVNCNIEEYVTNNLVGRENYDSEENYLKVRDSIIRTLSAPVKYHGLDPELNHGKNVYIQINDSADYLLHMQFQYIADAQGTSLIFMAGENVLEYILKNES